jgi:hypothetical protein
MTRRERIVKRVVTRFSSRFRKPSCNLRVDTLKRRAETTMAPRLSPSARFY